MKNPSKFFRHRAGGTRGRQFSGRARRFGECAGEGPREPHRTALVRPATYRSRGRRAAQGQLRHARQDHPDEAEAYLIKGFEANPDDPLAAAAMALHRLAQGKYQAALQWLRRS